MKTTQKIINNFINETCINEPNVVYLTEHDQCFMQSEIRYFQGVFYNLLGTSSDQNSFSNKVTYFDFGSESYK